MLGSIEYRLEGMGPTIMVLNGGNCSRDTRLSHERLTEHGFSALTPSRPGYDSTPSSVGKSAQAAADALAALLDTLQITTWEFIAFAVNSLIFMFLGIGGDYQDFSNLLLPITVAVAMMFAGRALAIYPLSALFSRSALQISLNHQHILFWGGLRGALALALALGLPPEFPNREAINAVAFAVVASSIFVQGLTIVPLLGKLKEIPSSRADF